MHKKLGGMWPEQLTLTDQRDIPHHRTFLFSNKTWGKEEEGCSELRCILKQQIHFMEPGFSGLLMTEHLPVHGKSLIN